MRLAVYLHWSDVTHTLTRIRSALKWHASKPLDSQVQSMCLVYITILLLDEVEYDLKNNSTEIEEGVNWLR